MKARMNNMLESERGERGWEGGRGEGDVMKTKRLLSFNLPVRTCFASFLSARLVHD